MREENWLNDYVFTVENFLTKEECDHYITLCEDIGFEEALVTSARGSIRVSELRNNDRVMFQNEEIANQLWERASDFVPSEMESRNPVGLNEMLRIYRYDPGQQFDWHQDFAYQRDNGEKSFWTFLIYLNNGFDGGETSFDDSCSEKSFDQFHVKPQQGLGLFFYHPTYHKGEPVLEGRKYVPRTDLMYSPEHDAQEASYDEDDFDSDVW